MPLMQLVITLVVVGILLWLVNRVHSDAIQHQVDPQWRRRNLRCAVDCESVSVVSVYSITFT